MRVEALLATRHFALASGEYTRLFQLTQNMDYLAKIAELTYYSLYEPEKAMKLVKDCLRSDPDHKLGNTLFKAFKKYEKIVGTSAVNVEAVKQLKGTLPSTAVGLLGHISSLLCKKSRSISTCQEAVDSYPDRSDLLKLYIEILSESSEISDLEKAKSLLNDAESKFSSERNTWHKLQSHLQVRIKQAKNIDYYKVLEVPRTATEGQIRKAYRTLAMLHHPDKQKTDEDRKKAEEKMRLINSAYAVLKDAEKKRVYDATGEDPDGPTSRQNPFGNGGDPFMRFFQNGNEGPFGGDNQNFFFFHG
ncbi:hypothetical protein HMI55_001150 [Coelomomyces lativittatus]|nr:hypothetical protein HMI55_001150 [Coelomomyces lativittatus]KAJ1514566.1 hypothetical protein HMI56_000197 [Coelomomyces lativittatus]